jgi:RNA ligase (TIGR02306 family)
MQGGNNMGRKLASIQRITEIKPIENADSIETVTILGWHCVTKKGEFKTGDLCIYCEVDSLLPDKPEFEFLKPRGSRISTIRLRGQISQGICFPLDILSSSEAGKQLQLDLAFAHRCALVEGEDLTEILEIKKWEVPIPPELEGKSKGRTPGYLSKTEEIRIQTMPTFLQRNKMVACFATEKVDGQSITVWLKDGEFNVASHQTWYYEIDNVLWRTIRKMDIETLLRKYANGQDIAIQGELLGPGIEGNHYKLKEHNILWFNIFDIQTYQYYDLEAFTEGCAKFCLQSVPVIDKDLILNFSVDELVEYSKGKSCLADIPREGVVIRSLNERTDQETGRFSFKVINPEYLLKFGV